MGAPVCFSPLLPFFLYPFLNFLSSCCQMSNLNFCFLFSSLSSLRLLPVCSSLLPLAADTPPNTFVPLSLPVYHLKCIFMEICKLQEASERTAPSVWER